MTMWMPEVKTTTTPGDQFLAGVLGVEADIEAAKRIEAGFPAGVVERFLKAAPDARDSLNDVLKMSPRTLTRRRGEGRLSPAESDRLYRVVALYALAADVLGSVEAADEWMTSPAVALNDAAPLDYSRNAAGAKRVERLLLRLEHGVYS